MILSFIVRIGKHWLIVLAMVLFEAYFSLFFHIFCLSNISRIIAILLLCCYFVHFIVCSL